MRLLESFRRGGAAHDVEHRVTALDRSEVAAGERQQHLDRFGTHAATDQACPIFCARMLVPD